MLSLVSDYKHDDTLRKSLSRLAGATFGLDLEAWYAAGFWDDCYVPYSLAEDGEIAANVSASRVELVLDGQAFSAAMLGTVMTAKDWRGKGCAARLMRHVLEQETLRGAAFTYLFANETVLDFYPRFGFVQAAEQQSLLALDSIRPRPRDGARLLDIRRTEDLGILTRLVKTGAAATKRVASTANLSLILFYSLSLLHNCAYYFEQEDLLVFWKDGTLYDYYSESPLPLTEAASFFAGDREVLALGFTPPADCGLPLVYRPYDDHLFITRPGILTAPLMFPLLSRA